MQIRFILNIKKKSKLNNIHVSKKILNEVLTGGGGGGWWLYGKKGLGTHVPLYVTMFMTISRSCSKAAFCCS
jgi:hypothetical protein